MASVSEGASTRAVTLDQAIEANAQLLANLLELYIHDLSEFFPDVQNGPDGRFGYRRLAQLLVGSASAFTIPDPR